MVKYRFVCECVCVCVQPTQRYVNLQWRFRVRKNSLCKPYAARRTEQFFKVRAVTATLTIQSKLLVWQLVILYRTIICHSVCSWIFQTLTSFALNSLTLSVRQCQNPPHPRAVCSVLLKNRKGFWIHKPMKVNRHFSRWIRPETVCLSRIRTVWFLKITWTV